MILKYNRNLFGEDQQIPIETKVSSDGAYIQYEDDGNKYFKAPSLLDYLKKMRKHVIVIMGKQNTTRSSRKINLIKEGFLNMTKAIKKVTKKYLFIAIMWQSRKNLILMHLLKEFSISLIKNKYGDLENEMEESRFNLKFVSKLKNMCKKVNEWKGSTYI